MINTAVILVLKAVWGQGHGRERTAQGDPLAFLRNALNVGFSSMGNQLANCPREYIAIQENHGI